VITRNGKKEPLFTNFAGALIGVLVFVVVSMVGYWAHHITQQTTQHVIEIAEVKRTDAKISEGLTAINLQLAELRAQIGAIGEFKPKDNGRK